MRRHPIAAVGLVVVAVLITLRAIAGAGIADIRVRGFIAMLVLLLPFAENALNHLPHPHQWLRARRHFGLPILAALGAPLAVVIAAPIGDPAILSRALVRRDEPADVDAVFVFSGDVDFHRTRYGVREMKARHARFLVLSGTGSGGDAAIEMSRAAEAAGVPHDAILLETTSRTTHENVTRTAPLLAKNKIKSVAVVTSGMHSRRAARAAELAWPDVRVISRPVPDDDPLECPVSGWERRAECRSGVETEWEKRLGYLLRGWN